MWAAVVAPGKPDRRPRRAIRQGVASGPIAGLAGTIDPQHDHIAGGLVAPGVGDDLVERPVAALASQLTHAGMLANRPETRMLAQAFNTVPDRGQPAPGLRS